MNIVSYSPNMDMATIRAFEVHALAQRAAFDEETTRKRATFAAQVSAQGFTNTPVGIGMSRQFESEIDAARQDLEDNIAEQRQEAVIKARQVWQDNLMTANGNLARYIQQYKALIISSNVDLFGPLTSLFNVRERLPDLVVHCQNLYNAYGFVGEVQLGFIRNVVLAHTSAEHTNIIIQTENLLREAYPNMSAREIDARAKAMLGDVIFTGSGIVPRTPPMNLEEIKPK